MVRCCPADFMRHSATSAPASSAALAKGGLGISITRSQRRTWAASMTSMLLLSQKPGSAFSTSVRLIQPYLRTHEQLFWAGYDTR